MLVNLSPRNDFRTVAERHCKYMNRQPSFNDKKYYPFKFTDLFEPTQYTGVYMCGADKYAIDSWCKQKVVYHTKGFRHILENIPRTDIHTYMDVDSNAWTYGVADNLEQIVQFYKDDRDKYFKGNHVILVFEVHRDTTSPCRGWRWHKWGEYIGTKKPRCEYLNDEPDIDKVLCFSILQVI